MRHNRSMRQSETDLDDSTFASGPSLGTNRFIYGKEVLLDRSAIGWVATDTPLSAAEQHRQAGGSRRALFERVARVAQPPGLTSSAGNPEGGWMGVAFFGLPFLAKQER